MEPVVVSLLFVYCHPFCSWVIKSSSEKMSLKVSHPCHFCHTLWLKQPAAPPQPKVTLWLLALLKVLIFSWGINTFPCQGFLMNVLVQFIGVIKAQVQIGPFMCAAAVIWAAGTGGRCTVGHANEQSRNAREIPVGAPSLCSYLHFTEWGQQIT